MAPAVGVVAARAGAALLGEGGCYAKRPAGIILSGGNVDGPLLACILSDGTPGV